MGTVEKGRRMETVFLVRTSLRITPGSGAAPNCDLANDLIGFRIPCYRGKRGYDSLLRLATQNRVKIVSKSEQKVTTSKEQNV